MLHKHMYSRAKYPTFKTQICLHQATCPWRSYYSTPSHFVSLFVKLGHHEHCSLACCEDFKK